MSLKLFNEQVLKNNSPEEVLDNNDKPLYDAVRAMNPELSNIDAIKTTGLAEFYADTYNVPFSQAVENLPLYTQINSNIPVENFQLGNAFESVKKQVNPTPIVSISTPKLNETSTILANMGLVEDKNRERIDVTGITPEEPKEQKPNMNYQATQYGSNIPYQFMVATAKNTYNMFKDSVGSFVMDIATGNGQDDLMAQMYNPKALEIIKTGRKEFKGRMGEVLEKLNIEHNDWYMKNVINKENRMTDPLYLVPTILGQSGQMLPMYGVFKIGGAIPYVAGFTGKLGKGLSYLSSVSAGAYFTSLLQQKEAVQEGLQQGLTKEQAGIVGERTKVKSIPLSFAETFAGFLAFPFAKGKVGKAGAVLWDALVEGEIEPRQSEMVQKEVHKMLSESGRNEDALKYELANKITNIPFYYPRLVTAFTTGNKQQQEEAIFGITAGLFFSAPVSLGLGKSHADYNHKINALKADADQKYGKGFSASFKSDSDFMKAMLDKNQNFAEYLGHKIKKYNDSMVELNKIRQERPLNPILENTILQDGKVEDILNYMDAKGIGDEDIEFAKRELNIDDTDYLFAGENATSADLKQLQTAKELTIDGVNPQQVYRDTGWFQDTDGKWRFEISDKAVDWDNLLYLESEENTEMSAEERADLAEMGLVGEAETENKYKEFYLDEIVDHPLLFESYPEMADTKIQLAELPKGVLGKYDPMTNKIMLAKIDRGNIDMESEVIDLYFEEIQTVLHEIQHGIQEIEGFSKGSSRELAYEESKPLFIKNNAIDVLAEAGNFNKVNEVFARMQNDLLGSNVGDMIVSTKQFIDNLVAKAQKENWTVQDAVDHLGEGFNALYDELGKRYGDITDDYQAMYESAYGEQEANRVVDRWLGLNRGYPLGEGVEIKGLGKTKNELRAERVLRNEDLLKDMIRIYNGMGIKGTLGYVDIDKVINYKGNPEKILGSYNEGQTETFRHILQVFRNGDVATLQHEIAHAYYSVMQQNKDFVRELRGTISKLTRDGYKFNRQSETEKFSQIMEDFVKGRNEKHLKNVPDKIKAILQKFKEYFTKITKNVQKIEKNIENGNISPEFVQHLENVLNGEFLTKKAKVNRNKKTNYSIKADLDKGKIETDVRQYLEDGDYDVLVNKYGNDIAQELRYVAMEAIDVDFNAEGEQTKYVINPKLNINVENIQHLANRRKAIREGKPVEIKGEVKPKNETTKSTQNSVDVSGDANLLYTSVTGFGVLRKQGTDFDAFKTEMQKHIGVQSKKKWEQIYESSIAMINDPAIQQEMIRKLLGDDVQITQNTEPEVEPEVENTWTEETMAENEAEREARGKQVRKGNLIKSLNKFIPKNKKNILSKELMDNIERAYNGVFTDKELNDLGILSDIEYFRDMVGTKFYDMDKETQQSLAKIGNFIQTHVSKNRKEILAKRTAEKGRTAKEVVNNQKQIAKGKKFGKGGGDSLLTPLGKIKMGILKNITNSWLFVKTVDGNKEGGLYDTIVKGFMNSNNKEAILEREFHTLGEKYFGKDNKGLDKSTWGENINIELKNGKINASPYQLMSIYMIAQQRDGLRHLLGGKTRITTKKDVKPVDIQLTLSDINKINGIIEGNTNFKQGVNYLRKAIDILGKYANITSRQMNGYDVATIKDYFPLFVNENELDPLFNDFDLENITEEKMKAYNKSLFLLMNRNLSNVFKQRGESSKGLVVLPADTVLGGLQRKITKYYAYAPEVDMAYNVLDNKTVKEEISNHTWGKNVYEGLMDIVKDPFSVKESHILEKNAQKLVSAVAHAGISSSIAVPFYQSLSYFSAKRMLPSDVWKRHFTKLITNPLTNMNKIALKVDEIAKYCPTVWSRWNLSKLNYAYGEDVKASGGEKSKMGVIRDITGKPIKYMDINTIFTIWDACLDAKKGNKKEAGELLHHVMVKTQPYYYRTGRGALARSSGYLSRMAMLFSSYTTQMTAQMLEAGISMKDAKTEAEKAGASRLVTEAIVGLSAQVLISSLIKTLVGEGKEELKELAVPSRSDYPIETRFLHSLIGSAIGIGGTPLASKAYTYLMYNMSVSADPLQNALGNINKLKSRWKSVLTAPNAYKREKEIYKALHDTVKYGTLVSTGGSDVFTALMDSAILFYKSAKDKEEENDYESIVNSLER